MNEIVPEVRKKFGNNKILNIFFIVAFALIFIYYMTWAPVWNQSIANRQGTLIHIASGETLTSIALDLKSHNIVRRVTALKFFVTVFGSRRNVPRGDYLFTENMPVWSVAWMLARGNHHINPTRITIKEGMTNEEIATLFATNLQAFRRDLFLSDPESKQGYLFPDTYFFFPLTTSSELIDELSNTFKKRISSLLADIESSGWSLDEIITMASLVEKEAQGESDASLVAGILWKRLKNRMLLQVDADRSTYVTMGLPSEPIGNPGLRAIKAALYPEDSAYFYYLHDKTGAIHLAKTYKEHISNINKYLR